VCHGQLGHHALVTADLRAGQHDERVGVRSGHGGKGLI
jgi:hypothetical protein